MVLELTRLELPQVVLAQNHMLDQLSYFLVEFYHVWLSVDKILDALPVFKHSVAARLLRTTSESINQLAEHLGSCEGLSEWLFDP